MKVVKIELFESQIDNDYIVRLADQPGFSALGSTVREALREFAEMLPSLIETMGVEALSKGDDK